MATKTLTKIAVSAETAKKLETMYQQDLEKTVLDIAENFARMYRDAYKEEADRVCSLQVLKKNVEAIADDFSNLYAKAYQKQSRKYSNTGMDAFTDMLYSGNIHSDLANDDQTIKPYVGYYEITGQSAALNVYKVLKAIKAGEHLQFMPPMDVQIHTNVAEKATIKPYVGYYNTAGANAALDVSKILDALKRGEHLSFVPDFADKTLPKEVADAAWEDFLACDQWRAGLGVYPRKMLTNPNGGHWDLWDADEEQEGTKIINLAEGINARDPAADIDSGMVAIDFGTKNTVVVYENSSSERLPLKLGGDYSQGYENPTVVEFIDLTHFLASYRAREGRPFTSWNQVTVGHQAAENIKRSSSDRYYSFFEDLKTWCAGTQGRGKIKDAVGHIEELAPFLDFPEDKISPVEIYAYYIGLFINNMHRGKIFLDYRLSFPVTFPENVREKIRLHFERGIRKSLPTALLANSAVMENFRVSMGVSEPAAYAVTALTEYGFEPSGEDACYYGVFDFGGGTTDFDFGVYRAAPPKQRRYDYELVHFGAGGDKTLGGENLLKLLAFKIFRANSKRLIRTDKTEGDSKEERAKIPFTQAAESKDFLESERFILDSEEAHANMHVLMEKLRPLWEEPESEAAKKLREGIITVDLFDENGTVFTGFQLYTRRTEGEEDFEEIDPDSIIENRIEEGIRKFFLCLGEAMDLAANSGETRRLEELTHFSIFLAGNSVKSKLVQKIFRQYIEDEDTLKEILGREHLPQFEIFPGLGTEEAKAKQAELSVMHPPREYEPTGKTGVAYGLLYCRDSGGGILVRTVTPDANGISFGCYVGYSARQKFCPVISPKSDTKAWEFFIDAGGDFDLYYTENAEAVTGEAPITIATRYTVRLKHTDDGKNVYLRPAGIRTLEYVLVADEEEIAASEKEGKLEIYRIELP